MVISIAFCQSYVRWVVENAMWKLVPNSNDTHDLDFDRGMYVFFCDACDRCRHPAGCMSLTAIFAPLSLCCAASSFLTVLFSCFILQHYKTESLKAHKHTQKEKEKPTHTLMHLCTLSEQVLHMCTYPVQQACRYFHTHECERDTYCTCTRKHKTSRITVIYHVYSVLVYISIYAYTVNAICWHWWIQAIGKLKKIIV